LLIALYRELSIELFVESSESSLIRELGYLVPVERRDAPAKTDGLSGL
jgi:hypothetical protein